MLDTTRTSFAEHARPGIRAELVPASRLRAGITTTAGFKPAELPLATLPDSPAPRSSNGAAAAAFNPGTPGHTSLFASWPWSAVGKVEVGHLRADGTEEWEFTGSGCMIGRQLMLTASHVAPWEYVSSTNWIMRFSPAYRNGPALGIGTVYVAGWHGTVDDTSQEGEMFGRDYVVCSLHEPIGDKVGWVPVTSLKESRYDDFTYTSVGYPGAVQSGQVPCVETGLTIQDIDDGGPGGKQLETRRYGGGGWSGGPLWATIDDEVKIAGVHSGSEKDGLDPTRTVHSGGGRLVEFVTFGLTQWQNWDALLLFYNRQNRGWATGRLSADGGFTTLRVGTPGSFDAWTHVIGGGNGAFFFYNQGDGRWATGLVQPDGGFKTVHTGGPGSAAIWTHVVGAGDGTLLFYNRDDGRWATGRLQANGGFSTLHASPAGEFDFWTHIAATFNGSVLFYEQGDRHWATGRLRPDGTLQDGAHGAGGRFRPLDAHRARRERRALLLQPVGRPLGQRPARRRRRLHHGADGRCRQRRRLDAHRRQRQRRPVLLPPERQALGHRPARSRRELPDHPRRRCRQCRDLDAHRGLSREGARRTDRLAALAQGAHAHDRIT